jgi:hypothetical protein
MGLQFCRGDRCGDVSARGCSRPSFRVSSTCAPVCADRGDSPLARVGPTVAALVLLAVLGDDLLVEPVRQVTFYREGFVLSLYLAVGGVFTYVVHRRTGSLQPK